MASTTAGKGRSTGGGGPPGPPSNEGGNVHAGGGGDAKREQIRLANYADLLKHCQNHDLDKAIKVANRLLHDNPLDETAFKAKVTCQINNTYFEEALNTMLENPRLCLNLQFELAYCHYRLQRIEESKVILMAMRENSLRRKELEYQIYYRLDDLELAHDMLLEVIKRSNDDLDEERRTNLTAVEAAMKLENLFDKVQNVTGRTYEMKYNNATGMLGEGKYIEAEALLAKTEKEAYEVLQDDGANEEDIIDELGLMVCQRGFCVHQQGRLKEAMNIYLDVLKTKPSDVGLTSVASNNILCLNKDQNVFDSKKRVKIMSQDTVMPKLGNIQRKDILLNQSLFYYYTGDEKNCKEYYNALLAKFPEYEEEVLMIKAALIAGKNSGAKGKKQIEALLKDKPEARLKVQLGLVQLALRNGSKDEAIALLSDLPKEDYFRPGIISALVTLYKSQGKNVEAGKILKEAVQHYRKHEPNKENMTLLWRQTANFMMEQGDLQEAAKSLEELRKLSPDDPVTLAQLIVAYSQHDLAKAKLLSKSLPPLDEPTVEVGVLESPNWLINIKQMKKANSKGESVPPSPARSALSTTSEENKSKSKSKKKKNKVPQNMEIERQPDPERWLAKFERSTYRPKRTRKGRVDVGKGTQGADTAASAVFDMSSKVGQSPREDSPGQAAWRKDASKKKKKKK